MTSQDFFRGKPCKLKKQFGSKMLGYLWDRKIENGTTIYHVKFDSIDFFTTIDMLDFEGDRDNISHLIKKREKKARDSDSESEEEETKDSKQSDSKNSKGPSEKSSKKNKNILTKNCKV